MSMNDIRPVKQALRQKYRALRTALTPEEKAARDRKIAAAVRRLWQYQACDTLLCYVSTAIEVDTVAIINQALQDGKKVAVPRCIPETRRMEFFYISALSELSPGTFGVLEPAAVEDHRVTDRSQGLCFVPALCYDRAGFRLGYGKGYYDRYLSGFEGAKVGLCYSDCVVPSLPHGRFDRPVETLVTERYIRRTTTFRQKMPR
ncbi:MAG: 5-formyltetrahydrofolate cyclo-ligase [Clostridia bacterium]|nr:5-formyltetrahydrofolate cyclo-ligase [Clostridia bacterium]